MILSPVEGLKCKLGLHCNLLLVRGWLKSQLCGGDETGQCGGGDREEDEREAASYNGQSLSPSLRPSRGNSRARSATDSSNHMPKSTRGPYHTISDQTTQHPRHSP